MALRAGYYGVKRFLRDKLETIARTYDDTIKSLFPRSEQAVLGARNIFNFSNRSGSGTTTGTADNFNLTGTGTWKSVEFIMPVEPNTRYKVKFNVEVTSGLCFGNAYDVTNSATLVTGKTVTEDTNDYTYEFTTSNNTKTVRLALFCTSGTSATGNIDVKNFEVVLASDTHNGYTSPVMTNKELTESAADQKTAINAIITAATGAADFAAFKTAMGAITPVTRSLSLTREDITEEVKEAEPEKTVTKKRTTKKTEEV